MANEAASLDLSPKGSESRALSIAPLPASNTSTGGVLRALRNPTKGRVECGPAQLSIAGVQSQARHLLPFLLPCYPWLSTNCGSS
eukprot:1157984-Pelagomonas_calceolata.AAC.5